MTRARLNATGLQMPSRAEQNRLKKRKENRKQVIGIVCSHIFTYFNLIYAVLAVLLCSTRSWKNLTFIPLVVANALVGMIQQLRSKATLDRMSLLNATHARRLKDVTGYETVDSDELDTGDIVEFSAGDQICADGLVVSGAGYVNESLLTGEENDIVKAVGDRLLSGSYVVSGTIRCRLTAVGEDSYISKLSEEAKTLDRGERSEMIKSINRLVAVMGVLVIPVWLALFYQAFMVNNESYNVSVIGAVAAVLGMIPQGLYFLTTLALALGSARLARKKVLLHDMRSIESLARVDVLCTDKTGTITQRRMTLENIIPVIGGDDYAIETLVANYASASPDDNDTLRAIREGLQVERGDEAADYVAFDSSRKYGAVSYNGEIYYVLGAPEIVMRSEYGLVEELVTSYTECGYRVLVFGRYEGEAPRDGLTDSVVPLGLVILANAVRDNAAETFEYFKQQGVAIKVISGDSAETVSEVAHKAGIDGYDSYVNTNGMGDDEVAAAALRYTVFGRVTPAQKKILVAALKAAGHTVAMTGDGVNDILAMKEADCSIALASGSEAASQAAQVVLLESDFAAMPGVVAEGRRVVNNIERSAALFLVKNLFSLMLSAFSLIGRITYPLEPTQISLITAFTIAIPGFFLALEPNNKRIRGHFMKNVLLQALPAAIADIAVVGVIVVFGEVFTVPEGAVATAATMLLAVVGFIILIHICRPFTVFRAVVLILNVIAMINCAIWLPGLFGLRNPTAIVVAMVVLFSFGAESLFRNLGVLIRRIDRYLSTLHVKVWRDKSP